MSGAAVDAPLYPALSAYLDARASEFAAIDAAQRGRLAALAGHVGARRTAQEPAELLFVCTHNSRRSQLAQLWAFACAAACGIDGLTAYSGGTEATAFAPGAVAALRRAGFRAEASSYGDNPRYLVRFGPRLEPVDCFSKTYDAPGNPRERFCAVMTCAEADAACPRVEGAVARIALPYEDPKGADGSPREAEAYDACCRVIARDLLYALTLAREPAR